MQLIFGVYSHLSAKGRLRLKMLFSGDVIFVCYANKNPEIALKTYQLEKVLYSNPLPFTLYACFKHGTFHYDGYLKSCIKLHCCDRNAYNTIEY